MADIRPKDLLPTAESPAADDYLLLDGATEGTRKILAPLVATPEFATVGDLLSSATYSAAPETIVRAGGYRYQVAATGAKNHHLTTAGGVKLYVLPQGHAIYLEQCGTVDSSPTTGDNSALIALALSIAGTFTATAGPTNAVSYRPKIVFPAGPVRFTTAGTLTADGGGTKFGVHFAGQGMHQTHLIYDNPAGTYACATEAMWYVTFSDMMIEVAADSKFILHHNGAWLFHEKCFITGPYNKYLMCAGTFLGSETHWHKCEIVTAAGGTFMHATNLQSLNHNFVGVTFNGFGTFLHFEAGGNVRIFGGFASFGDGAKFLLVNPTEVGKIGTNNFQYVIDGVQFEKFGDADGDVRLAEVTRGAKIVFTNCNLNPIGNANDFANFYARQNAQDEISFTFNNCHIPGTVKFDLRGRSDVFFENSYHPEWDQMFLNYDTLESTNYLSPIIRVRGAKMEAVYDADPFVFQRFGTQKIAVNSPPSINRKAMIIRSAPDGRGEGLLVGDNSTYAGTTGSIPLGSMIIGVRLVLRAGSNWPGNPAHERTYKISNSEGNLLAEMTWTPNTDREVFFENFALHRMVSTPEQRIITVSGKVAQNVEGNNFFDTGYAIVEYF